MTEPLTEQLLVSRSGVAAIPKATPAAVHRRGILLSASHPEDGVPTDALKVARCKKDPWGNACQVSCGHVCVT